MKKTIILIICITSISSAHAYIDPGTAGVIIGGGIWPFILGILILVGLYTGKIFEKMRIPYITGYIVV